MHILYVSYPGGGLETNVRVIAGALLQLGHRVSILSPGSRTSAQEPLSHEHLNNYSFMRGNVHYYFHRATLGLGSLSRVVRSLEETHAIAREVRRIHARDPVDLIEVPEIFASRRTFRGIPFVVRLHGAAWAIRALSRSQTSLADVVERRMEGATLRSAAGISTPSRALAEYISGQCGIELNRIVRILYPIDTRAFAPDSRTRESMVLFVGRVERDKGADVLLKAVGEVRRRHPSSQFVFVGAISEDMKRQVSSPGDGVQFVGQVPRGELVEWYRRAAVLCVPSLWDNSPNTIYESMACGCPVVGTSVGGIPELIDHGVTGLLVPRENPTELARAICEILGDSSVRAQWGARSREKAETNFGVQAITRQFLDFYGNVLRQH